MSKKQVYECEKCGAPFNGKVAEREKGWARFCSKSCGASQRVTGNDAESVFELILHAVENQLETPSQSQMSEDLELTASRVQRSMSILLGNGRVIKHSGGWATTYTIPGVEGGTVRRESDSNNIPVDNFANFDHVKANRRMVAALAQYFRNRETAIAN